MSEKIPEPSSLDSMEGLPRQDIPLDFIEDDLESVPVRIESREQLEIVELTSDMWEKYKEIRLRAGGTDPQAFGTSVQKAPHMNEAEWRNVLANPDFRIFAIEVDGKIAATAGFKQKPDGRFILTRVYTTPEVRGKGFSKALIEKVLIEAKALGAKSIELEVTEDGSPAFALYKKLGFEEFNRKQEMRGDEKVHTAVYMRKML